MSPEVNTEVNTEVSPEVNTEVSPVVSTQTTWAVVVNWNGGRHNRACLLSLIAGGLAEERIVFVDNASSDGSRESVAVLVPGLVTIQNPRNLGFGAAANQGARAALQGGAEAVLFVNNDVTLPPETLSRLVSLLAANPRVGMIGPRVLLPGEPTRVWAAGGVLTWGRNLSELRGHGQPDGPRWRDQRAVDYVPGCALLARRALLEGVGLFEESYFAYMEDVELGLRARQAGWQLLCAGEVACVHAASSSTGGGYNPRRKYMNALNAVRFLRAHGSPGAWLSWALRDVAPLPLAWLAALPRGGGRALAAKALGTWHGLLGRRVTARAAEPGGTWLW